LFFSFPTVYTAPPFSVLPLYDISVIGRNSSRKITGYPSRGNTNNKPNINMNGMGRTLDSLPLPSYMKKLLLQRGFVLQSDVTALTPLQLARGEFFSCIYS